VFKGIQLENPSAFVSFACLPVGRASKEIAKRNQSLNLKKTCFSKTTIYI